MRARNRLRVFPIDYELVDTVESYCLELARYANQDVDKVEAWPLNALFRRYRILAKIVEKETGGLKG